MKDLEKSPELKRLEKNLTVDLLWIYILSILKEKKLHAYAIRKKIEEKFSFKVGNVTSYVVLYKLEANGFVESKKDGNRKVYTITTQGKQLFKEAENRMKKKIKMVF